MKLSVQEDGAVAVVAASGELDLEFADSLRDHLNEAIAAEPERLVVDLSGVTFVDSTILGVLVGARNRLGANSDRLQLVASHPEVLKTFRLTGLDQVFHLRPTMAEFEPPR